MTIRLSEVESQTQELIVCLVGMPNSGKTTLMNAITGGNFRTANYPGVTVSLLRGKSKPEFGPALSIVDLPGVHSSVAPSPEEELACRVIEGNHARVRPDAFVLVADATQLERRRETVRGRRLAALQLELDPRHAGTPLHDRRRLPALQTMRSRHMNGGMHA